MSSSYFMAAHGNARLVHVLRRVEGGMAVGLCGSWLGSRRHPVRWLSGLHYTAEELCPRCATALERRQARRERAAP